MDTVFNAISTTVLIVVVLVVVVLRVWLGSLIAKAAQRRLAGYSPWFIAALFLGVVPTWVLYMLFIHGRPVVLDD